MKSRKEKYYDYISSDDWRLKREQCFLHRWKVCQKCWNESNLQVHHWTYQRLFKENMADLFVLCWNCHIKLHELFWLKDLLRATRCFIKWLEYKPKKKRKRLPLEVRRAKREERKKQQLPLAINAINNWIRFSKSWVTSMKTWRLALKELNKPWIRKK